MVVDSATEWLVLLVIILFVFGTIGLLPLVWGNLGDTVGKFWKGMRGSKKDDMDVFAAAGPKPHEARRNFDPATPRVSARSMPKTSKKDVAIEQAHHPVLDKKAGSLFQKWEKHHPEEPDMVNIPAGEFWMGSDRKSLKMAGLDWQDWMIDERPYHQLHLPAYAIGRYQVTNAEYARFIRAGGYRQPEFWTEVGWQIKEYYGWTQPYFWTDKVWNPANYPVIGISWYECVAYCRWLTRVTGQLYRLPSEAEWEKAARGTQGYLWPWGNSWDPNQCNSGEKDPGHTTPIGHYSPAGNSPYNVSDMVGNVWEWCTTRWKKLYPYDVTEDEWTIDYLAGTEARMLRGGSWDSDEISARCAYRLRFFPDDRNNYRGCRVVAY